MVNEENDVRTKPIRCKILSMSANDIHKVIEMDRHIWAQDAWPPEYFVQIFNDPSWYCWVLKSTMNDEEILGYGHQQIRGSIFHIANLAIDSNYRGYGLGEQLLSHMINHSKQMNTSLIELEVNTENRSALNLYHKHGFSIINYFHEYYANGNHAYHMSLPIY